VLPAALSFGFQAGVRWAKTGGRGEMRLEGNLCASSRSMRAEAEPVWGSEGDGQKAIEAGLKCPSAKWMRREDKVSQGS